MKNNKKEKKLQVKIKQCTLKLLRGIVYRASSIKEVAIESYKLGYLEATQNMLSAEKTPFGHPTDKKV